ncbi:pyruvate kinase [uncultured Oscillibacter sp.]|uniref:pyruvate kinase n=1 Tax=uncultured Oscillibacter sp. TaxID=876091 RepID=UPI0025DD19E2|nr:pyruvate kinase [uncultured Oscillibacter sp.]
MQKYILTTGPALAEEVPLSQVHSGRNIYRINGAHGGIPDVEQSIRNIRGQIPGAEILLDLPGNKVRTANISEGIRLEKGKTFEIASPQFNYPDFYRHLKPGMTAWANDSVFEFEVIAADSEKVVFLSKSDGVLINNKGVHVRGIHQDIPFLFEKDRQLIRLANQYKLEYVGLSFVRTAENVKEARALIGEGTQVISKIETIGAVEHINEILPLVNYILVDRGDLSTDIGIEKIPRFQRYIIDKALYFDVKVFLATQVLKNMETKPIPTIGEIEALYEIMKSGVYGVQMSEETAVGRYAAECVELLERMNQEVMAETIGL